MGALTVAIMGLWALAVLLVGWSWGYFVGYADAERDARVKHDEH